VEQDRTAIGHFPTSPEELNQYDAIVLGDVSPLDFQGAQLENLAKFVLEQAGGLVLIAGARSMPFRWRGTPLEPLIPVDLKEARPGPKLTEPFRLELTPEGASLPAFRFGPSEAENRAIWQSLAGHYWYLEAPRVQPAAIVLATHPELGAGGTQLPAIVMQYAGSGKVLALFIDSTWRWRDRAGDRHFGRFWLQSLRYVSRSRLLGQSRQAELTVDRSQYVLGQPVRVRVRLLDETLLPLAQQGVQVLIESDRSAPVRLTLEPIGEDKPPRIYETRWRQAPEGAFRVSLLTPAVQGQPPATRFQVVSAPDEFRRVETAWTELQQAAELSGGRLYGVTDLERLPDDLPSGRKIPLEVEPPMSLWDRWPTLLLFCALLTLEWALRKKSRML
jgi:uncharacterized membrane protein